MWLCLDIGLLIGYMYLLEPATGLGGRGTEVCTPKWAMWVSDMMGERGESVGELWNFEYIVISGAYIGGNDTD